MITTGAVFGGIDVGGTKTHAIVTDETGTILGEQTVPTGTGPEQVLAGALRSVRGAAAVAGVSPADLACVGVGIPGRVDPIGGIVWHAVNLGVVELALGDGLSAALGVPVFVDNDVKAASLGAARHLSVGEDGGPDQVLSYINFGTGLALSTVSGGRIWHGSAGFAGEIGHLPLAWAGIACPCGQIGCLETIASGAGMLRRWQTARPAGTVTELDEMALAGDPLAVRIWRDMVLGAALAIKVAVLTINPAMVAIGGGVAHGHRDLFTEITRCLEEEAARSAFVASLGIPARLRLIPESASVAAVGAVLLGRAALAATVGAAP